MLDFRILGPLEVIDGDRAVTPSGAVQRALLAILLLHVNRVVSGDRLSDLLWGDHPPASGATALQVRISQLRKGLGEGGAVIVTRAPGYLIRLDPGQLDLHRFERLVERADRDLAANDPASAAAALQEALAQWSGQPLVDFTYAPFAQAAIGRLEELRLAALEKRVEADLALGRHAALIAELRSLTDEHPLRERLRAQLMLALYRAGRQAEALAEYQAGRRVLVEELGIEPGPDLQRARAGDPQAGAGARRHRPRADPVDSRLAVRRCGAQPAARRRRATGETTEARESCSCEPSPIARRLYGRARCSTPSERPCTRAGVSARAAAFTSSAPARDLVRVAREQDVDLMLLDAPASPLDDPLVRDVLISAPCDVALLAGAPAAQAGSFVLVPFGGGEHDWAAVELGAWFAAAERRTLRLVGSAGDAGGADASRQLASASLAIQVSFGVAAEPLLVPPGSAGLLSATEGATLVVAGLSERWERSGLGAARLALATEAPAPTLLVRRGLRPGGLAPRASLTRFTWSVGPPG